MIAAARVGSEQKEELLQDAIYRHAPLTLSCRLMDGWASFHSRFLASTGDGRQIVIAYPALDRLCPPEFAGGERVGVAFRRGHYRCTMSTIVLRQCRFSMTRSVHVAAIVLAWPDDLHQLRRRLYYRSTLPAEMQVRVELARVSTCNQGGASCAGRLTDISLGGLSLVVEGATPGWRRDSTVTCHFTEDPGSSSVALAARLCYAEEIEPGCTRIGVQFTDLDTCGDSGTLARVARFCTLLQQRERDCRS